MYQEAEILRFTFLLPTRQRQTLPSIKREAVSPALALVAEHHGRRLRYLVAADHPELDRVNAPLLHIAHRQRSLRVETINELPLRDSPYLAALERQLLLTRDHKQWYLMPR